MARLTPQKQVFCYHCGKRIKTGRRTMSTSCPGCGKAVLVEDIVVSSYKAVSKLETCGRLVVNAGVQLVAQKHIVANDGIDVEGVIRCQEAATVGNVHLAPTAVWRGDLRAGSLLLEPGAKIDGVFHWRLGKHRDAD